MMPAGRFDASSLAPRSCATISEYTCASRTRRAMSWAYCAPRSTTRTGRGSVMASLVAHPDALLGLIRLALGLDRRRDHEFRLLELLDRLVAGGRHRRRERPEQVERAVVLVRRAGEDLLDRGDLLRLDPSATREGRMEGRHPPVVAAAGRLVGAGHR